MLYRSRSTIEVHLNVSDVPHLRSSIPHPKTDFSKKRHASRRIIPWPKSRKSFFEIKIGIPTILGSRNPVFQKQNSGNVLYLHRITGLRHTALFQPMELLILVQQHLILTTRYQVVPVFVVTDRQQHTYATYVA